MKDKDLPPILQLPPESPPSSSSLATKLARIMGKATYIQKTNRNQQQGYNYVAEADYLDMVKPLLAAENIAFLPSFEIVRVDLGQTKSGTPTFSVMVKCHADFIDGDSGETCSASSVGQGIDTQDKAPYKAMTGAVKYLLSKTFLIPTGDDPEKDEPEPAPPPQKEAVAIDPQRYTAALHQQIVRVGRDAYDNLRKSLRIEDPENAPDETKRSFFRALKALP